MPLGHEVSGWSQWTFRHLAQVLESHRHVKPIENMCCPWRCCLLHFPKAGIAISKDGDRSGRISSAGPQGFAHAQAPFVFLAGSPDESELRAAVVRTDHLTYNHFEVSFWPSMATFHVTAVQPDYYFAHRRGIAAGRRIYLIPLLFQSLPDPHRSISDGASVDRLRNRKQLFQNAGGWP